MIEGDGRGVDVVRVDLIGVDIRGVDLIDVRRRYVRVWCCRVGGDIRKNEISALP